MPATVSSTPGNAAAASANAHSRCCLVNSAGGGSVQTRADSLMGERVIGIMAGFWQEMIWFAYSGLVNKLSSRVH